MRSHKSSALSARGEEMDAIPIERQRILAEDGIKNGKAVFPHMQRIGDKGIATGMIGAQKDCIGLRMGEGNVMKTVRKRILNNSVAHSRTGVVKNRKREIHSAVGAVRGESREDTGVIRCKGLPLPNDGEEILADGTLLTTNNIRPHMKRKTDSAVATQIIGTMDDGVGLGGIETQTRKGIGQRVLNHRIVIGGRCVAINGEAEPKYGILAMDTAKDDTIGKKGCIAIPRQVAGGKTLAIPLQWQLVFTHRGVEGRIAVLPDVETEKHGTVATCRTLQMERGIGEARK